MGKIILIVLGVILVGYTIFANRTTNRLRREQRDDYWSYNRRWDRGGFLRRTKRREDEAKDTWALQDALCWIFWIAVIVVACKVFG